MADTEKNEYEQIVGGLKLSPHPEGGYYAETYRSHMKVQSPYGERSASTAIYFLITKGSLSRLHRIKADEVWHFYKGGPMNVVELLPNRPPRITTLGPGFQSQYVVRANTWFGSFPCENSGYSLVGCTVAPGFEFEDFELASRAELLEEFPESCKAMIIKLTEGLP